MKALCRTLLAGLILLPCAISLAAEGRTKSEFGLGLVVGEPSGLNAQFFWGPKSAVDITAAWSWNNWFMTMADFQIYDYIGDAPREWRWYYGLGGYLAVPDYLNRYGILGIRVPLGIRYNIPHSQVDVWAEVAPALQVIPDTEAEFHGGLGVTLWLW